MRAAILTINLNMYKAESFEPGSGISDVSALEKEILKINLDMKGQPHAMIKAVAFAFVLEHIAIFVNPKCWFGFNIVGLRFGGSPKGLR